MTLSSLFSKVLYEYMTFILFLHACASQASLINHSTIPTWLQILSMVFLAATAKLVHLTHDTEVVCYP